MLDIILQFDVQFSVLKLFKNMRYHYCLKVFFFNNLMWLFSIIGFYKNFYIKARLPIITREIVWALLLTKWKCIDRLVYFCYTAVDAIWEEIALITLPPISLFSPSYSSSHVFVQLFHYGHAMLASSSASCSCSPAHTHMLNTDGFDALLRFWAERKTMWSYVYATYAQWWLCVYLCDKFSTC